MNTTLAAALLAMEGKRSDGGFQPAPPLETTGKRAAIRCLAAAVESFLAARELSRQQLAEDICGMSEGNFSKVINGVQGDFLGLLHDKLPAEIRKDYYERMAEIERADPLALAMEQLTLAIFRVLRAQLRPLPAKAERMAHAEIPTCDGKRENESKRGVA